MLSISGRRDNLYMEDSMKGLVVDDSAVIRQMVTRMMKPFDFELHEAENGAQAVAEFKEALHSNCKYDLVVLDIEMPEMDGQQALKEIRMTEKAFYGPLLSDKEYATIIMLTSLDDPGNFMEAYKKGKCNGYLTKPIVFKELEEKLRSNNLIQ